MQPAGRTTALVALAGLLVASGCDRGREGPGPEAAAGADAAAAASPAAAETAEALFERLRGLPPAEARLAIYDAVETTSTTERMLARFLKNIQRERQRYARLVNEQFAPAGEPRLPTDLGMEAVLAQWREAALEPWGASRVRLNYVEADGEPATLTFRRYRGSWRLHPSSLMFGRTDVNDIWFGSYQFTVMAELRAYRDTNDQLESGNFESAEEAAAALEAALAEPPPGPGAVMPEEL
jgi:hypothetical protein